MLREYGNSIHFVKKCIYIDKYYHKKEAYIVYKPDLYE